MENKKNLVIGVLAGAAAGAAAGVALGYVLAHNKEDEKETPITKTLLTAVTEVALAKGIEALHELQQKYAHKEKQTAQAAA